MIGRFVNYLMKDGKKSTVEKILYASFDEIQKNTKEEPLAV